MRLVGLIIVAAVGLGYLLGGRLSRLSELPIRLGPLALVGLLLQLWNPSGRWPFVILLLSFALLFAFTVTNRKITGFAVITAGLVLNVAVIALNGGMPVSRHALVASDQTDTLLPLLADGGAKHHLATDDDRLLFLADVIPIPSPIRQVISVGDLFTYGGVVIVVVAGMRRRGRSPERIAVTDAGGVRV
jgi:hypothetical protein